MFGRSFQELEGKFLKRGLGYVITATPPMHITGQRSPRKKSTVGEAQKKNLKKPVVRQSPSKKITKDQLTKERLDKKK